ncbi:16S rRNA processing protein RimM [Candidatus Electrothrix aarhusensis]|jgi:16S rRNA processing protein RimM|uniref:Ribosome maturation factor RimM n=1 Tax=Candidatus Electrothrix aarhusensis TaxID=1859131 RepID=A0A3S3QGS4_9BACT|nr:16S rRNA processing protein RimM [Candidatus Electrothrix aarhusensis]
MPNASHKDVEGLEDFVPLGKITKAHSIRGEIKVFPFSGSPETMLHYSELLLVSDDCVTPTTYRIERARVQKNAVLLQLKGCSDRNAAEKLVGSQVYVHKNALPEPNPDEFYLRDLEGKLLKTIEGRAVGRITGFLANSAQDLLCVQGEQEDEEYLIPLIPEFLHAVDEDEVTVSLPPGLLEINS